MRTDTHRCTPAYTYNATREYCARQLNQRSADLAPRFPKVSHHRRWDVVLGDAQQENYPENYRSNYRVR